MRLPKDMRNLMNEIENLKKLLAEKELAIELLQDALKKEVQAIIEKYDTSMGISEISRYIGISRSSFYSKRNERKRGRKKSSFTIRVWVESMR